MISAALIWLIDISPLPQKTGFIWRLILLDMHLSVVQNTIDDLPIQAIHRSELLSAKSPDEVQRQKTKRHQVVDDAGLIPGQAQCTQGACFCQQDQDGALPAAEPG